MCTQSGPKGEVETNFSPEEGGLVTRCTCQQAGPCHLIKWWGVSIGQCIQVTIWRVDLTQKAGPPMQCASLKSSLWVGLLPSDLNELSFCWKLLHKGSIWRLQWLLIYCYTSATGIVYRPIYLVVKEDRVMDHFSSVTFWVTVPFINLCSSATRWLMIMVVL